MASRQRRSTRANRDVDRGPHKTLRKHLMRQLEANPGSMWCPHCGRVLFAWMQLDLDHTDDRRGYRGLACRPCNRRAGQRLTMAILQAKGWQPSPKQLVAIRAKAAKQARRQATMVTMPPVTMGRRRSPR
jgi:hypothetical protein